MKKRKFNAIDFVVIFVIVALIFAAAYKFIGVSKEKSSGIMSEENEITYSFLIEDVRNATVDAIHIGDIVYDSKTNESMGEVINKEIKHHEEIVVNKNGEFVSREKPERFDIVVSVKAPVLEKDDGYFISGIVELKRNSKMEVYTKYAQPAVKVLEIDM